MKSSRIDYIRITGILEMNSDSENTDVTFNIEHSADKDFSKLKTGIITLRLSEIINISGYGNSDIEIIASQLVAQVLVRERDENRAVNIFHNEGLPIEEWLMINTPTTKH